MYQDWETVVIRKDNQVPKTRGDKKVATVAAQRAGGLTIEKKFGAGTNKTSAPNSMHLRKIEDETEIMKHERVDRSLSQAIQQARLGKKMSQKDLALQINEKLKVISEYESGKAIPNPQVINKIERALGTQLPRAKKSSKKPEL